MPVKATNPVAMINLKLKLDNRRIKKDGTYPLVFRITSFGARDIQTGYSCKIFDWNEKKGFLKESHPLYQVIGPRLKGLELKYYTKIVEFEKVYAGISNVQTIKEYLISEQAAGTVQNLVTVRSFWKEEIELLHKAKRNGGAVVYELSLNAVAKIRNLDISFEKVDYVFLKQLEADFVANGLNLNSVGVHFRTLRAVYNKAIKSKVVSIEFYPFKDFKIRKQPTSPRVLKIDELRAYFNLQLEESSWLYESWLKGKLMFMLIGINFNDLVLLSEDNLKNERLVYVRSKTKKQYNIKLHPLYAVHINCKVFFSVFEKR